MPRSYAHAEAAAPQPVRPLTSVNMNLPARFMVGSDGHGGWVVQDRLGRIGGLFASETAALHFAREECDHNPIDVCRAPEGVVLALTSGAADRTH